MSAKETIKRIVDSFNSKPYLKDKTREMGEGLMLGASLADESNERSKEARNKAIEIHRMYIDQILAQDLNPGKDPELVDIRKGFETAGERIADFEQKTTSQITQNKGQSDVKFSNFEDKVNSPYLNIQFPPAPFAPAIPDGVTDAQPTIQGLVDLLAATGGGIIFMPPGNFLLKSGVKWASGVSLIGTGYRSKISVSGTIFNPFYNIDGAADGSDGNKPDVWLEDCRFENFQLDGSGFTHTLADASGKGLFILYMKRAVFKNLWIHHTIGTGLGCDFLVDTVIEGVIAENCGRNWGKGPINVGQSGIGVGTSAIAKEPTVIKKCFTRFNGNYGIFVETQQNPSGVKALGAKVVDCYTEGNRIGAGNKGSGGTMFVNIDSTENEYGLQLTEGSKGDKVRGCNIFKNTKDGVIVGADYKGNLDWNDNDIYENALRGILYESSDTELKDITSNGNRIYRNGYAGVSYQRTIDGLIMGLDRVRENGTANVTGSKKGVDFTKDVKNFVIVLNLFGDSRSTKTQLEDIVFASTSTLTNGIIGSNNAQENGIVLNDATLVNVTTPDNLGIVYKQSGSGTIPVNVDYVKVDFSKPFTKPPSTVMIMQQSGEVIWVTDITRFGFFARRETEFGGKVNKFKYIAEI